MGALTPIISKAVASGAPEDSAQGFTAPSPQLLTQDPTMQDQTLMDEFTYLSVLIGLILGLGITQLMEGIGRLAHHREKIDWYWPLKLWIGTLLILHIQAWWAMYELRHIPHWTFISFLVVLIQPMLLFLLSALALPDAKEQAPSDLRKDFNDHALFTFRISTLMVLSSLLKEYWLYHRLPHADNLLFHGAFILIFLAGSFKKSERCFQWVILGSSSLLMLYILRLFMSL